MHTESSSSFQNQTLNTQVFRKRLSRSRSYKNRRQLNEAASSEGQMRITDFYGILNEIQILAQRNQFLQDNIRHLVDNLRNGNSAKIQSTNALTDNSVLKLLLESAEKHSTKDKHGYRHNDAIKKFASYIRMLGGNLRYEMLHANLRLSIPPPSTISSYIRDKGPNIT